jgi:hypothetical protein
MRRASYFAFASLVVLLAQTACAQDVSESVARAKVNLSRMFVGDMYDMVRMKLAHSGLSPQDVDRAAQVWSDGVASCAVDALASDPDPQAMQILKALSSSETELELSERWPKIDLDEGARLLDTLKPKLEECFAYVLQDAGIVR